MVSPLHILFDFFGQTRKGDVVAVAAILVAATIIVFPGLGGEFLNWDDDRFIIENSHVDGLSLQNFRYAFNGIRFESYQPLHLVSYMIDGQLWPGRAPLYRAHNLALYFASLGMLFMLLRRLGIRTLPAAVGTLFFAVAPYRIESIIWITSRKDVLTLFFSLLAWHIHLARNGGARNRLALDGLAVLAFTAAVLSKSSAVVVPFMILCADVGLRRVPVRRALMLAIPYLALVAAVSVLVPILWTANEMTHEPLATGLGGRIELVGWSITHYVKTALWPFSLSPIYAEPKLETLLGHAVFGFSFIAIAAAVLFVAYRRGGKVAEPAVAFAWFSIGIAPFLNVIPLYYLISDRYLLFASFGVALLAAHIARAILDIKRTDRRLAAATGILLLVVAWGTGSIVECRAWRSSESLWRHATTRQPDSFFARLKFGETLRKAGQPREAADQYREARRIRPGSRLALTGVFWSELARDAKQVGLTTKQQETVVYKFAGLLDDGPGLLKLVRDLKRHGLLNAANVALNRVNQPLGTDASTGSETP
ncbi:MAG: hypothetical protein GY854_11550 [Deltaproteobacteria bacterium]|nr:hypothetical protein [Deltaproteobacteria bacterium]